VALGLAGFVVSVMGDEVVRGARARARSRDENPPLAVWRLATRNRRRYGGYLVHAGVCVMAVAVAVSATLASDVTATLESGESASLGAYTVSYDSLVIEPLPDDPRVTETRAELTLSGPQSGRLTPALRDYPNSTTPIATPTVRTALGEDLYVTLLAYDPDSRTVTLHLFVNPLVVWIWVGGAIVTLGAAFAIWPDSRRLALPAAAGA
jgi:cytochrome c-type biogenesis protein CcmF